MARGCASGGGEEGDREHQQPSPWSGYISVRFFTASESNTKLGVSTTPRAYSWCRSMRLPKLTGLHWSGPSNRYSWSGRRHSAEQSHHGMARWTAFSNLDLYAVNVYSPIVFSLWEYRSGSD